LTYKAAWQGKRLVAIPRFFPSTRRCSRCAAIGPPLALRVRAWTCPSCDAVHDRDVNAAVNIRDEGVKILVAAGRADTENACGARVRLPMGAAGAEAGIQPASGGSVNMEALC
jgi:transposase